MMSVFSRFLRIVPFYFPIDYLLVVVHFDLLDCLVIDTASAFPTYGRNIRGICRFSVAQPMSNA